tara:strand:+ start:81 stop:263 length:183 start_codon:yes stop_codon:yes gene_type:complete
MTKEYDVWEPSAEEYATEYDNQPLVEHKEPKNTKWIPVAAVGGVGLSAGLLMVVLKGLKR